MTNAPANEPLKSILQEYESFPEFIGIVIVDVNQRGAVDNAPLHLAARCGNAEHIQTLVEHGADIDMAGDLGFTPLHFAALTGHIQAATTLLRLGAHRNLRNEFKQTAGQVAELGNHKEVERLIQNWAI